MTDTSALAYESILPHASRLAKRVFVYILDQGSHGATCEECEFELAMQHQTVSARITELKDTRLVHDSGRRRETSSGRWAAVLVVVGNRFADCDHARSKWIDSLVEDI